MRVSVTLLFFFFSNLERSFAEVWSCGGYIAAIFFFILEF